MQAAEVRNLDDRSDTEHADIAYRGVSVVLERKLALRVNDLFMKELQPVYGELPNFA